MKIKSRHSLVPAISYSSVSFFVISFTRVSCNVVFSGVFTSPRNSKSAGPPTATMYPSVRNKILRRKILVETRGKHFFHGTLAPHGVTHRPPALITSFITLVKGSSRCARAMMNGTPPSFFLPSLFLSFSFSPRKINLHVRRKELILLVVRGAAIIAP